MRATYLADTSVMARASKPTVAAELRPLVAAGEVALCAPVLFELGFAARSPKDHRSLLDGLLSFAQAPVTAGDHERAIEFQSLLAEQSAHRTVSLVDALVAAVAESRDLTVLHYDRDFERLASVAPIAQRWIVAPGIGDH